MSQQLDLIAKTLKLTELDSYDELKVLKAKTGVNPSVIALAVIVFLLICLIGSSQALQFVISIGCFLIPAYFSFVALQSPEKQDDIKYLNYWIIFAFLEVVDPLVSLFMSTFFYGLTRLILTVLFLHPSINFAGKIYHKFVEPQLIKNESLIDKKLDQFATIGTEYAKKYGQKAEQELKKKLL